MTKKKKRRKLGLEGWALTKPMFTEEKKSNLMFLMLCLFCSKLALARIHGFQCSNSRAKTVQLAPQLVPSTNEMLSQKTRTHVKMMFQPLRKYGMYCKGWYSIILLFRNS